MVGKRHIGNTKSKLYWYQKTAQLERALQQEAAALASGNPVAIAAATANVAKATHEKMIAQQEYPPSKEKTVLICNEGV